MPHRKRDADLYSVTQEIGEGYMSQETVTVIVGICAFIVGGWFGAFGIILFMCAKLGDKHNERNA